LIKKIVSIADEVKLIIFKNKPRSESVEGRRLTRYDLSIRQEAILPFYNKVREEINKDSDLAEYGDMIDQGLVEYLQSAESKEVFDYFDKNNFFVFYVDNQGFPAIIRDTMRVVPSDTAIQLKDKQINVTFNVLISNINQPLNIEAPKDSISIEQVISDFSKNMEPTTQRAESAKLKSDLSTIRTSAEIFYDGKNSYGNQPFSLGPCKQTPDTLFANTEIVKYLESATKKKMSLATCVSKGTVGKVASYAISVPLPDNEGFSWCVDSSGSLKQIVGILKSDICK